MKNYDFAALVANMWLGFSLVCLSNGSEKTFALAIVMAIGWSGLSALYLWRQIKET